MTSLKYKDENGFWQEFQVGTNVVANPIIAGTESELTGLQVGDTKYKMPAGGGGKLYLHSISLKDIDNREINGTFLSTRGTQYDVTDSFTAYFLPGSTITINSVIYGIKRYGNLYNNSYRDYNHFNITTYESGGGALNGVPTINFYLVTEV